jgi:uncharacterized phiE125 gp8 family phage protein
VSLSLVTAPAVEPLTLDETKAHLRVESDDENGAIYAWIVAARQHVESYTHRALLPQTWDLKLDAFPCWSDSIRLPKAPVTSVTSVTYLDTSGVSQTWSSSLYLTDLPTGPHAARARITPAYAQYYPSTYDVPNAVTVRFVAGYTNADAVPMAIKAAMLFLIGHWYMNRSAVAIGSNNIPTAIPMTVEALLWPFTTF